MAIRQAHMHTIAFYGGGGMAIRQAHMHIQNISGDLWTPKGNKFAWYLLEFVGERNCEMENHCKPWTQLLYHLTNDPFIPIK